MGRPFTDEEKEVIYDKLINIGKDEIGKQGAKKTSIQQITKRAGVSKGTFYSFFESKEEFFFKVLDIVEDEIKSSMVSIIPKKKENFRENLIDNLIDYLQVLKIPEYSKFYRIEDIRYIFRGIPHEEIEKHIYKDIDDIKEILSPAKKFIDFDKVDWEFIITILRFIFYILYDENNIGGESEDKLLRAQITILVDTLMENN